MANIKISELPAAGSVSTADVLVVNQGATTRKATVSQALAGVLTTNQIAGLATTAPAALSTTAIAGLSTFAARADHQHVFPTLGELGAQAALTTSAPLALSLGGTGQISYTDGQLLIGNSVGNTLNKANLTGIDNVAVTNGNGSISIGVGAGAYLEFFEHFMSTSPLAGNIAFAVTGGTNTIVNAGLGIIAMSTGATAAANQQSRLNQAATNAISSGGSARAIFRFAQSGATWFDGTLTGALRCGWGDSTTGESANAVYFRSQNGQGIDFITKSGNVETLTSTGVSFADGVFRNLEILINSTGTQVIAKIDGTTVATHTTNIPSSRLIFFTHINRVAATGTAVVANLDSIYLRLTPNTPFF